MVDRSSIKDDGRGIPRESENPAPHSLSRLPYELLICVAECILPDDIVNFSATCRLYREAARKSLRTHMLRKEKFSMIDVGATSEVLFRICGRPWIALYPKYLTIKVNNKLFEYWSPYGGQQAGIISEFSEKSAIENEISAIAERISSSAREQAPWLNRRILGRDKDSMISLVLATLPNVEDLSIRFEKYQELILTRNLIGNMVAAKSPILPRLSKITLIHDFDRNSWMVETFNILMPFMALPQLRTVDLVGAISHRLIYWPCDSGCSEVTHISFHHSAVSGRSLRGLLSRCKALEYFSYTPCHPHMHRRPSPAIGLDWDPRVVRDALLKTAKDTLKMLTLWNPHTETRQFIGSLREFAALDCLRIETRMLLTYDPELLAYKPKDILPASIEFVLLTQFNRKNKSHKKLLKRLRQINEGLPKLWYIAVFSDQGLVNRYERKVMFKPKRREDVSSRLAYAHGGGGRGVNPFSL